MAHLRLGEGEEPVHLGEYAVGVGLGAAQDASPAAVVRVSAGLLLGVSGDGGAHVGVVVDEVVHVDEPVHPHDQRAQRRRLRGQKTGERR